VTWFFHGAGGSWMSPGMSKRAAKKMATCPHRTKWRARKFRAECLTNGPADELPTSGAMFPQAASCLEEGPIRPWDSQTCCTPRFGGDNGGSTGPMSDAVEDAQGQMVLSLVHGVDNDDVPTRRSHFQMPWRSSCPLAQSRQASRTGHSTQIARARTPPTESRGNHRAGSWPTHDAGCRHEAASGSASSLSGARCGESKEHPVHEAVYLFSVAEVRGYIREPLTDNELTSCCGGKDTPCLAHTTMNRCRHRGQGISTPQKR
jgi:hypothetical protein